MDMKVLESFNISTDDISESGERRYFTIIGDIGATFTLIVKNEDNYYYNFTTKLFQAAKSTLKDIELTSSVYNNSIFFPAVTDADTYEFSLHVDHTNTKHSDHIEVRKDDGSYDVNLSTGSNSALMERVIYQTLDKVMTISSYSPNGMSGASTSTQVIKGTKSQRLPTIPFSITVTADVAKAFQVLKKPQAVDVMAFVTRTVGAAPIYIPGENIYPAISDTDTVNGAIVGGGSVIKVVMDNNVADKMVVGDKITAPVTTDTINGDVGSGVKFVMDNNVAGKMAIGDQITAPEIPTGNIVTVAALNPDGDNVKEFSMSEAIAIEDGVTLTFSPKCNRELTTVVALNPDTDNAKEFSMSQNVGFVDGVTLSFSNQRNYYWPLSSIQNISQGASVVSDASTNGFPQGTFVKEYNDIVISNEGTVDEIRRVVNHRTAINAVGLKPTITTNATSNITTTIQRGQVCFNNQALLSFAGAIVKIYSYGEEAVKSLSGYDLSLTDMEVVLTPVTTTTTAASAGGSSTSVVVASRNGILDDVSTVSGIGINPSVIDPTVDSGAGAVSGAGTIVLTAAQSLENGTTLTFVNAGTVATITGNITIHEVGNEDITIRLDLDKLLSYT